MGAGLLQPTHIIFVIVIALLVFGPKRLPEMGRSIGHGIREFKDSIDGNSNDASADTKHEAVATEPASEPVRVAALPPASAPPAAETPGTPPSSSSVSLGSGAEPRRQIRPTSPAATASVVPPASTKSSLVARSGAHVQPSERSATPATRRRTRALMRRGERKSRDFMRRRVGMRSPRASLGLSPAPTGLRAVVA